MTRAPLFLVTGLAAVGAGLLLWAQLRARGEREAIGLVDTTREVEALLASREGTRSNVTGRGPFTLEPLDESTARTLFVMHSADFVFDPQCYYRYRPGVRQQVSWPEHPAGHWSRATNAAGLREDTDEDFAAADLRVLVTGDSHTDGVCNNDESFANQLEARLAARDAARSVVALNAGVVGYSFYNYLGVLEEGLAGEHGGTPDVFVVAVYGGNDFVEALRPQHYFRGTTMPPKRLHYWDRIEAAQRVSSAAVGQGLNQVAYFLEQPDQLEVALEASSAVMGEIRRRCAEHGIRLIVVHIPAAFDQPWPELEPLLERALEALSLRRSDLDTNRELEAGLRGRLEELGVEYLDMGPRFAAAPELCYWTRDLHISLAGQRAIAGALDELLAREAGTLEAATTAEVTDGPFERRDEQGRLLVRGAYQNGLRSGEWVTYHPDGEPRARGSYVADQRTGVWKWWYAAGQLQKSGSYDRGQPTGTWHEWYRNGTLRRTGDWISGAPHGSWREWYEDGSLASEGRYEGGRYEAEWHTYHRGGGLESLTTWRAGELEGPTSSFFESGELRWRGTYRAGQRHGLWTYGEPGGRRISEGRFVEGKRSGTTLFYDEEGRIDLERSGVYEAGERVAPLPAEER